MGHLIIMSLQDLELANYINWINVEGLQYM